MKRLPALKVLLIEDNLGDVLLLRTALEADHVSTFALTAVETLADGLNQIQQAAFDVVLVDLGLPDSAGLQTFERIHKANLNLPVVVFSGNEDEQQAVDAVHNGAQDYLVKSLSGFEMVARTIRYAIERNNLHGNLRESEQRFSALFRSNPVPVGITRQSDYRIVDVNDAWTNLTGYTRDEAIGHTSTELGLVKPEILQQVREILRDQEEINQYEVPLCRRSGQERLVLLSSEPIQLGSETYILNNLLDITERKQAEAEIAMLARFPGENPNPVLRVSGDGLILNANPASAPILKAWGSSAGAMVPEYWRVILQRSIQSHQYQEMEIDHDGRLYSMQITPIAGEEYVNIYGNDITERKHAQEELGESQMRFATIFENSPNAIGISRLSDNKLIEVNSAFLELFEHAREEVIGHTTFEMGLWAIPEDQQKLIQKLQKDGFLRNLETIFRNKRGIEISVLLSAEIIEIDHEPCLLILATDITRRKKDEETLRESEEKYRSLVEAFDALVLMLDGDGRIHYLNEKAAQVRGLTPQDALEKTLHELLPKEIADLNVARVQSVISSNQSLLIEAPVNSGANWYRISIQPIHNADGRAVKVLLSAVDISELKAAQQDLQDLNSTLEARVEERTAEVLDLYNNAPNGYHSLDANGTVILINQTELNWLGYTREEVVGIKTFQDLITQSSQKTFAENFPHFKKQGWISDLVFEMIRKDGSTFPALLNATAIQDEHGQFIMSRSTLVDVTGRKQAEDALRESRDELRRANAALEKASRLKDEFLASMSHELRTPLTGILGLSEALQLKTYGELSEKQIKALKNIEVSGYHLLELINDILDLSKIESSKFDIYPEMLNIEDTCRASLIFVKEQAAKKSILLEYQEAKGVKSVFADSRRLKQILVNLLSNAVKFTPEKGKVTLAVRADPEMGRIHFSVADTGIGIAKEDLDRLFTPFTQVDSRLNRQYEGTGLGLVLVLRLAEMHGGNVQVETEPGKGSTFTVSLPWQAQIVSDIEFPDKQAYVQNLDTHKSNSRGVLLLAEDNPTNIHAIGDFLQFQGFTLVIASNGMEVLIKAEESNPRLILMDVQMPVMDGLETMRRLRADPRFTSTPIIALTALAMTGDRERCLEAGADDYLSKPVSLKELVEKIEKLLHQ